MGFIYQLICKKFDGELKMHVFAKIRRDELVNERNRW
jgi:hypothetical protein